MRAWLWKPRALLRPGSWGHPAAIIWLLATFRSFDWRSLWFRLFHLLYFQWGNHASVVELSTVVLQADSSQVQSFTGRLPPILILILCKGEGSLPSRCFLSGNERVCLCWARPGCCSQGWAFKQVSLSNYPIIVPVLKIWICSGQWAKHLGKWSCGRRRSRRQCKQKWAKCSARSFSAFDVDTC